MLRSPLRNTPLIQPYERSPIGGRGLSWEGAGAGGGGTEPVAPIIAGTIEIGASLTITPGTAGDRYSLYRDGVIVGGATDDLTEAAAEAYVLTADDIYPDLTWEEHPSGAPGTGSQSNALAYALSQHWRNVWDPADAVVTDAVDSLPDSGSHGGVDLAATLTVRPAYNATDAGFGGEPSITFDGVNDSLTNADLDLGAALTAATVFVLARIEAAGGAANDVWAAIQGTGDLRLRQVGADATAKPRWTSVGAAVNSDATTVPGESVEFLAGGTWTGGSTQSVYVDSATAEDTDTPNLASLSDPQTVYLGSLGASLWGHVTIALAVFNASDDDGATSIDHLVAYCTNRFGVP